MESHLLLSKTGEHSFGKHGPLIGRALIGNQDDLTSCITITDGLRRADASTPIAQNHIGVFRILAERGILYLYLHKLVPAHAADRAGIQGCVEDLTAD